MRFDRRIELFIIEDVADGLGGHTEVEKAIATMYANVEELSLETTSKIFGDTLTQNAKAIVLGGLDKIDKIKIDDTMYKVLSQRKVKNKTIFFLEVDND